MLATSIGDPRYNDRYVVRSRPDVRARSREAGAASTWRASRTSIAAGFRAQDLISWEVFKSGARDERSRDSATATG